MASSTWPRCLCMWLALGCLLHWGHSIYPQSTALTLRSFFGQLQMAETSWHGMEGTGHLLRPHQPCSGRPSSSMACSLSFQTHGIPPALSLTPSSRSLSIVFHTHHLTPRVQSVGTSCRLPLPVRNGERRLNCSLFCRTGFKVTFDC